MGVGGDGRSNSLAFNTTIIIIILIIIIPFGSLLSLLFMCWHNSHKANYVDSTGTGNKKPKTKTHRKAAIRTNHIRRQYE